MELINQILIMRPTHPIAKLIMDLREWLIKEHSSDEEADIWEEMNDHYNWSGEEYFIKTDLDDGYGGKSLYDYYGGDLPKWDSENDHNHGRGILIWTIKNEY